MYICTYICVRIHVVLPISFSTMSRRRLHRDSVYRPARRLETNPFTRRTLFADSKLLREQPTECLFAEISDISPTSISTPAENTERQRGSQRGTVTLEFAVSQGRTAPGRGVKGVVGFVREGGGKEARTRDRICSTKRSESRSREQVSLVPALFFCLGVYFEQDAGVSRARLLSERIDR